MQGTIGLSDASGKQPSTATFTDPQTYQAAVRPARVEVFFTAKGKFKAELTEVELPRVRLQRGRESLPRIANATVRADRTSLYFLADPDQASTRHSGRVLAFGEIIASASGSTHRLRTEGPCHWATLSMTRDELAAAGNAIVDRNPIEPSVTQYFRPPLPMMSRLLNLHHAAENLAAHAPDVLAQPEAARALENALVHAMIKCLSASNPVETTERTLRHTAAIARFEELLAAKHGQPLHLAEMCAAIGASERTLRASCIAHLGMGPVRYLWLRRMHLAHRALILTSPGTSTVTKIATANGFWELGRFAVEYGALFGEAPSATLRRPVERMRKSQNNPSP